MQHYWVVIYIAVAIMVIDGHPKDLHVEVVPVHTRFAAIQKVNVLLKYTNTGTESMAIYKWYLPETNLCEAIFEVTRDGERVEYVGPIVKRRTPTADDMINLSPGTSMSTIIELSSVYNMTQTGNYVIQYKMNADQVLTTMDNIFTYKITSSYDGEESILESAPAQVFVVGRRNLLIEQAIEASTQIRALTPTFISCTATRSSSIRSAISAAENYANDAIQHLNRQPSATVRYTTWFGSYSSNNWLRLQSHFSKIQSALYTKSLVFDCSCPGAGSQDSYAYVYSNQPYKIYLCNSFWPSSITGTDSKAGTIIHELAHFTIVVGTDDYAYGHSAAQTLARSNPARALMNSDNLEYFAENIPALN
jgi:peptidyl-Lys metalloendopeptidase